MAFSIDQAFVTQFQDQFHILAQQRVSRLENLVNRRPGNVTGEAFTIDTLAKMDAILNRPRHSSIQPANMLTERRYADMIDAYGAEWIDEEDKLKLLIEPANGYMGNIISALNREKDKQIINAMGAATRTRSGTASLPSSQLIANGGTGLTLAKLQQAKVLLDDAEMDDSDFFQRTGTQMAKQDAFGNLAAPSYVLVCSSRQLDNLLSTTEVKSADYNTVKALVSGAINTFMGFQFVRVPTAFLPVASSVYTCYAYAPKAIQFGVGKEPSAVIERIAERNLWQVLGTASYGAARAEDAGVVSIDVV